MARTFAFGRVLSTSTINGIRFTPREGEFLRMIGNGLCLREIAKAMGITYSGAGAYQSNLRFRLGFQSRLGKPFGTVSATQELYQWLPESMKRANRHH